MVAVSAMSLAAAATNHAAIWTGSRVTGLGVRFQCSTGLIPQHHSHASARNSRCGSRQGWIRPLKPGQQVLNSGGRPPQA